MVASKIHFQQGGKKHFKPGEAKDQMSQRGRLLKILPKLKATPITPRPRPRVIKVRLISRLINLRVIAKKIDVLSVGSKVMYLGHVLRKVGAMNLLELHL